MARLRNLTHRIPRTHIVRPCRRLTRAHVRPLAGFAHAPDPLAQMLTAYRRAIRAYRRLARLAPHHYDPAVVERDAREREEQRRWIASWEPDLEKVYGPPTPEERAARRQADLLAGQPPPLHPNTQRAVNRALADFEFWKAAGTLSQARYQDFQRRHPHDIPRFGQIASLLELAFDFGWIATGLDWRRPAAEQEPSSPIEQTFAADLRRAYGDRTTDSESRCAASDERLPPTKPACSRSTSADASPTGAFKSEATCVTESPPVPLQPQPAIVVSLSPEKLPSPSGRRDAWATWARYQRRQYRR